MTWLVPWRTRRRREEEALAARRELGSVALIEERSRDVWRWTPIDDLISDLRYALRQLRRSPSFALATIVTLALGIGANTTVFSIIDAILLRPLPFSEPDRLVSVESWDRRDGGHPTNLSYPTYFDFRRDNTVFDQIVCYRDAGFTLTGRGQPPRHVAGEIVSWNLFQLLEVQPILGRAFLPAEEARGQHVVILSHALIGLPIGLAGALIATRLLTQVLADSSSSTTLLLIPTCAIVIATALMAAYLPARRAASIDPTRALRTE